MNVEKQLNLERMIGWLLAGIVMYALAYLVGSDLPAVQTVFYKLGHVTTLAWVGYWISRQMLGRIDQDTSALDSIARAILAGCVILAGSMGL